MRTISDDASVRLYHLDAESGATATVFYGPLGEALRLAAEQPEDVQDGLWLQTVNDVVAYRDAIDD